MLKDNKLNTGTSDISTMSSNNRICNSIFPRDIVCLRNISINTLHKGDDDYDDTNNILLVFTFVI